jgi:hypothetical protein
MYQSLIYKEWIKTRKTIALMALVFVAVGIYSFMKINEECRLLGMVSYWENLIQKGIIFFTDFRFLPLLLGILLAITQYVPELQSKRLKLTLHLPLSESKIIVTMLLYGLSVTLLFVAASILLLLWGLTPRFPREIVSRTFELILPWFLAGPAAYLTASWICLEPLWKQRILNFTGGACVLSFFFINAKAGACRTLDFWLIAFVAVAFLFPFYSALRFKEGK